MRAILLAAGRGTRLAGSQAQTPTPKCLIRFDGVSLLERHLNTLAHVGVHDVSVVVGFAGAHIEDELTRCTLATPPRVLYNDRFERGSVVSLWTARDQLTAGDRVLLMDADVLYDERLLNRLAESQQNNCFLLDRGFEPGDEPVKLLARNSRVVDFSKTPQADLDSDTVGESVGFVRLSPSCAVRIAERCQRFIDDDRLDAPHEEAIRELILERDESFGYEDVTGIPWIEIDFPDDVHRAKEHILPQLISITRRAQS